MNYKKLILFTIITTIIAVFLLKKPFKDVGQSIKPEKNELIAITTKIKLQEPIKIYECAAMDDGGSIGIAIVDGNKMVHTMCLANQLDGFDNLVLGSFTPQSQTAVPVKKGGSDEKNTIYLLNRFFSSRAPTKLTECEEMAKFILRKLRERN